MIVSEKLAILTDAAKYDVSCASSGVARGGESDMLGNSVKAGICHSFTSDGRCISLLKVLYTNFCIYDCKFCINRISNDIKRTSFTPKELCELTYNFYIRNYIEGLFLSSGIIKNANYTTNLIFKTISMLRNEYHFNGYIHVKVIPGTDQILIDKLGAIVDRMSINIELPSEKSLQLLAPDKNKSDLITPMKNISHKIIQTKANKSRFIHTPSYVPGGQSTQMIVGATNDSDLTMLRLTEAMYKKYSLKRVYFSAYIPINIDPLLPSITNKPPMFREHRLYQADFLLRFYKFTADEILTEKSPNFNQFVDPKCQWALNNLHLFPMEINKVSYEELLRIPGIGVTGAKRIVATRRLSPVKYEHLKSIGIVVKRAKYFITCHGKYHSNVAFDALSIKTHMVLNNNSKYSENQLSFFTNKLPLLEEVSNVALSI